MPLSAVGCFVAACVQGSGFGFRAVQIGFASCCGSAERPAADEVWDASRGASTRDFDGGLRWGIAATETSINGHFYKHLPASTLLFGPASGKSASWVMASMTQMRSDLDSTVTVTAGGSYQDKTARLNIAGYEVARSNLPRPFTDLPRPSTRFDGDEAVLALHEEL